MEVLLALNRHKKVVTVKYTTLFVSFKPALTGLFIKSSILELQVVSDDFDVFGQFKPKFDLLPCFGDQNAPNGAPVNH